MQNTQSKEFDEAFEEIYEQNSHKLKALEINSKQFYSQLKPLFTENAQLKSHLISLNFFIEERKIQLSQLIGDTGPNGEDRVLTKAVSDLKQICDMLEEEIVRQSQTIQVQQNNQEQYKIEIKELRDQLSAQGSRAQQIQQQLIDSNTKASEYHKQQMIVAVQKANQQKMKMEDFQSQIMSLRIREKQIHRDYAVMIEKQTESLKQQLQESEHQNTYQAEQFELERRAYLKQLEQLNTRLNDIKEELISQYEYKLATQKIKLDDQIEFQRIENKDLRQLIGQLNDKLKLQADQWDKQNIQIHQLNNENQEFKFRTQETEQSMLEKDNRINQLSLTVEIQKDQIQQWLRNQNKVENKKSQPQVRVKSISQSQHQPSQGNKANGLWKKAAVLVKREPYSKVISNGSPNQVQSASKVFNYEDESMNQYTDEELLISPIKMSKQISTGAQRDMETQTTYEYSNFSYQLSKKQSQDKMMDGRYNYNHIGIQCQFEGENTQEVDRLQNIISKLQVKITVIDKQHQQSLEIKDDEIRLQVKKLQEYQNESNLKFEDQLAEMQQIHSEMISRKNSQLFKLQQIIDDKDDRIKGLEYNVEQYEQHIEELLNKHQDKLTEKEQEIQLKNQEKSQLTNEAQLEQKRLLNLGQEINQSLQNEIDNLRNQHQLDQEIIRQEQQKVEQEKQDTVYIKKAAQQLVEQVQSKEQLLNSYKMELLKTTEIVKYLQLELENYKKINNIFRPKNDTQNISLIYNGMGFLPLEIQDKIKTKMNKIKYSELMNQKSKLDKDAYALNFSHQRAAKMKAGRTAQLVQNKSVDTRNFAMLNQFTENEPLPRVNTKRIKEFDPELSAIKFLSGTKIVRQVRSKTQCDDLLDDTGKVMSEINMKEQQLLRQTQQLMQQINESPQQLKQSKRNNKLYQFRIQQ